MKTRRNFLAQARRLAGMASLGSVALGSALALSLAPRASQAADAFPSRPIKIIVPFGPGGLIDSTTRYIAQKMTDALGQPVVVENRTGADGLIGIRFVKSSPADGYIILSTSNSMALSLATKLEPGYEIKDFIGLGGMNEAPMLLVGTSAQPDTSLPALLARARSKPDNLSYASGGVGTSSWMASTLLASQAGVKAMHVPYKGVVAAVPDVLAGRVNMMFDTAVSAGPHLKAGTLRAFAVSSASRMPAFPDVPTVAEQGIANFSFTAYQGLVVPAGTPPEAVRVLSQALRTITASEEFRQRNLKEGSESMALSGDAFLNRLRQDSMTAIRLATEAGIAKQ